MSTLALIDALFATRTNAISPLYTSYTSSTIYISPYTPGYREALLSHFPNLKHLDGEPISASVRTHIALLPALSQSLPLLFALYTASARIGAQARRQVVHAEMRLGRDLSGDVGVDLVMDVLSGEMENVIDCGTNGRSERLSDDHALSTTSFTKSSRSRPASSKHIPSTHPSPAFTTSTTSTTQTTSTLDDTTPASDRAPTSHLSGPVSVFADNARDLLLWRQRCNAMGPADREDRESDDSVADGTIVGVIEAGIRISADGRNRDERYGARMSKGSKSETFFDVKNRMDTASATRDSRPIGRQTNEPKKEVVDRSISARVRRIFDDESDSDADTPEMRENQSESGFSEHDSYQEYGKSPVRSTDKTILSRNNRRNLGNSELLCDDLLDLPSPTISRQKPSEKCYESNSFFTILRNISLAKENAPSLPELLHKNPTFLSHLSSPCGLAAMMDRIALRFCSSGPTTLSTSLHQPSQHPHTAHNGAGTTNDALLTGTTHTPPPAGSPPAPQLALLPSRDVLAHTLFPAFVTHIARRMAHWHPLAEGLCGHAMEVVKERGGSSGSCVGDGGCGGTGSECFCAGKSGDLGKDFTKSVLSVGNHHGDAIEKQAYNPFSGFSPIPKRVIPRISENASFPDMDTTSYMGFDAAAAHMSNTEVSLDSSFAHLYRPGKMQPVGFSSLPKHLQTQMYASLPEMTKFLFSLNAGSLRFTPFTSKSIILAYAMCILELLSLISRYLSVMALSSFISSLSILSNPGTGAATSIAQWLSLHTNANAKEWDLDRDSDTQVKGKDTPDAFLDLLRIFGGAIPTIATQLPRCLQDDIMNPISDSTHGLSHLKHQSAHGNHRNVHESDGAKVITVHPLVQRRLEQWSSVFQEALAKHTKTLEFTVRSSTIIHDRDTAQYVDVKAIVFSLFSDLVRNSGWTASGILPPLVDTLARSAVNAGSSSSAFDAITSAHIRMWRWWAGKAHANMPALLARCVSSAATPDSLMDSTDERSQSVRGAGAFLQWMSLYKRNMVDTSPPNKLDAQSAAFRRLWDYAGLDDNKQAQATTAPQGDVEVTSDTDIDEDIDDSILSPSLRIGSLASSSSAAALSGVSSSSSGPNTSSLRAHTALLAALAQFLLQCTGQSSMNTPTVSSISTKSNEVSQEDTGVKDTLLLPTAQLTPLSVAKIFRKHQKSQFLKIRAASREIVRVCSRFNVLQNQERDREREGVVRVTQKLLEEKEAMKRQMEMIAEKSEEISRELSLRQKSLVSYASERDQAFARIQELETQLHLANQTNERLQQHLTDHAATSREVIIRENALHEALRAAETERDELRTANAEMRQQLDINNERELAFEAEKADFVAQMEALNAERLAFEEVRAQDTQMQLLQAENASLAEDMRVLRDDNTTLKSNIDALERQVVMHTDRVTVMESELQESRMQQEALRMQLKELSSQLETMQLELATKDAAVVTLQSQVEHQLEEMAAAEAERQEARQDATKIEETLHTTRETLCNTEDKLAEVEEKLRVATQDASVLMEKLKARDNDCNRVSEDLAHTHAELALVNERLTEMDAAKQAAELKSSDLEDQLATAIAARDRSEAAKRDLESALERAAASAGEGASAAERRCGELEEQLAAVSARLSEATANKSEAESQLAELTAAKRDLESQMEGLRRECAGIAARVAVLEHERDETILKLENCLAERDAIMEQMPTLIQQNEQIASQLSHAEADNSNLAAERDDLAAQLASEKERVAGLLQELNDAKTALADAELRCDEVLFEKTQIQQDLEEHMKNSQQFEAKMSELDAANASLRGELQALTDSRRELAQENEALKLNRDELLHNITELHATVEALTEEKSLLETTFSETSSASAQRIHELDVSLKQKDMLLTELRSEVEALEEKLAHAQQENKDLLVRIDERGKEDNGMLTSLREQLSAVTVTRDELSLSLVKTKRELDESNANCAEKIALLLKKQDEIASLEQSVVGKDTELDAMRLELQSQRTEDEKKKEMIAQQRESLEHLEGVLAERTSELDTVNSEMTALQAVMKDMVEKERESSRDMQQKTAALTGELQDMKKKMETILSEMATEKAEHIREREVSDGVLRLLRVDIEASKDTLTKERAKFEKELQSAQLQRSALECDLQQAQQRAKSIEEDLSASRTRVSQLLAEQKDDQNTIMTSQTLLRELKSTNSSLESALRDTEAALHVKDEELAAKDARIARITSEASLSAAQLTEKDREIARMQARLDETQKQLQQLRAEAAELEISRQYYREQVQSLTEKQNELSALIDQRDLAARELQSRCEAASKRQQELEDTVEALTHRINEADAALEQEQREAIQTREELAEAEKSIASLREALERAVKEREEITRMHEETDEDRRAAADANTKLKQKLTEVTNQMQTLENTVEELRSALDAAERARELSVADGDARALELRALAVVYEDEKAKNSTLVLEMERRERGNAEIEEKLRDIGEKYRVACESVSQLESQLSLEKRAALQRWEDMRASQSALTEALERSLGTIKALQSGASAGDVNSVVFNDGNKNVMSLTNLLVERNETINTLRQNIQNLEHELAALKQHSTIDHKKLADLQNKSQRPSLSSSSGLSSPPAATHSPLAPASTLPTTTMVSGSPVPPAQLLQRLQERERELVSLRERLAAAEKAKKHVREEYTALIMERDAAREETERLKSQLDALVGNDQEQSELRHVIAEAEAEKAHLVSLMAQLEQEKDQIAVALSHLQADYTALQGMSYEAQVDREGVHRELQHKNAIIAELGVKLDKQYDTTTELQSQNLELQRRLDLYTQTMQDAAQRLLHSHNKYAEMKRLYQDAVKERDSLSLRYIDLQRSYADLDDVSRLFAGMPSAPSERPDEAKNISPEQQLPVLDGAKPTMTVASHDGAGVLNGVSDAVVASRVAGQSGNGKDEREKYDFSGEDVMNFSDNHGLDDVSYVEDMDDISVIPAPVTQQTATKPRFMDFTTLAEPHHDTRTVTLLHVDSHAPTIDSMLLEVTLTANEHDLDVIEETEEVSESDAELEDVRGNTASGSTEMSSQGTLKTRRRLSPAAKHGPVNAALSQHQRGESDLEYLNTQLRSIIETLPQAPDGNILTGR